MRLQDYLEQIHCIPASLNAVAGILVADTPKGLYAIADIPEQINMHL